MPWTWRSKCDKLWEGADEGVVMRRLVVGFALAGLMVLPSLVTAEPAGATVPGENGLLVYVQDIPSQVSGVTAGEIYAMNPDGTVVRRLTRDAGRSNGTASGSDVVVSENFSPRWSPDSPIIAYVHMNESSEYSVRLMDAEGTFIRTVTDAFSPVSGVCVVPGRLAPRYRGSGYQRRRRRDLDHRLVWDQPPSPGQGRTGGWLRVEHQGLGLVSKRGVDRVLRPLRVRRSPDPSDAGGHRFAQRSVQRQQLGVSASMGSVRLTDASSPRTRERRSATSTRWGRSTTPTCG